MWKSKRPPHLEYYLFILFIYTCLVYHIHISQIFFVVMV